MQLPTNEPRIPLQPHPWLTRSGNHLIFDFDTWTYDIAYAAEKDGILRPFSYCVEIIETRMRDIKERLAASTYSGYLTGKGNFRLQVATLKPYKGNRKGEKPHWYQAIRDYLVSVHGAIIVDGMEADDACAIEATANPDAIVVSRDKDFYQLHNFLYKYPISNQEEYFCRIAKPYILLLIQILTGDSTDNYPGIPGIGNVKASRIVSSNAGVELRLEDCFNNTVFAFIEHYGEQGVERFLEQFTLAFLVRELKDGKPVLPEPSVEFLKKYY